jgi:predicted outer membrane protein
MPRRPPTAAHAVDALPDARFVGFSETINDFMIKSGQLALSKSTNELVRGFATRAVAEHTQARVDAEAQPLGGRRLHVAARRNQPDDERRDGAAQTR